MLQLAMGQPPTWEPLVDVLIARAMNVALGGYAVSPWDVPHLDQVTIDTITSVVSDLPALQRGMLKVEQRKAQWRQEYRDRQGRHVH